MTGPKSIALRALGTTAVLATTDGAALPAARGLLVCGLRAFDLACSRFREDSELTALNAAAGRPFPVGELLWDALQVALRMSLDRINVAARQPNPWRAAEQEQKRIFSFPPSCCMAR